MKAVSVLRASLLVVSAFATAPAPAIAAPTDGGLPSGILWPAERLAALRQAHETKSGTDVDWPHKNISKINRGAILPMVLEASSHYPDGTFPMAAKPDDVTRHTREWLRVGPL